MTVLVALVLVGLVVLWLGGRTAAKPQRPPSAQPHRPLPTLPPPARERDPDVIGGWLIGHQIAQGHDGFPGDPLPHGHLGSAANLAFWGTVFDEEDEDL